MSDLPGTTPLAQAFDTPASKRRHVRRLFGTIAGRYDLVTRILSFGLDQRWKRRLLGLACVAPGSRVIDLACGTGDLALAAAAAGGRVAALDLAQQMIEHARVKRDAERIGWLVGDMTDLPFRSGGHDVVLTGYGLRNVPDLPRALAEMHRVLRPGGVLCSLDFNRPGLLPVRVAYLGYLTVVGAALGWILHRDTETYRYIPASIRRYPGARAVVVLMRAAGFHEVRHYPVLGGLMAIHVARR